MSFLIVAIAILLYFGGRHLYFKPKYKRGEIAGEFEAVLIDGSLFRLSDLQGKYVLLDFWGSWCGPCRMENPHVVELYEDFSTRRFTNAEGFEIVGIAIEMNEIAWKKAIERDRLSWKFHIGQFERFSSPLARKYGVREIPTKYLLDTDGSILMINPRIAEFRQFLSEKDVVPA